MAFVAQDPQFEQRVRASFARQGAMALLGAVRSGKTLTVCHVDAFVEKAGQRGHCASGLLAVVRRAGVKD